MSPGSGNEAKEVQTCSLNDMALAQAPNKERPGENTKPLARYLRYQEIGQNSQYLTVVKWDYEEKCSKYMNTDQLIPQLFFASVHQPAPKI